MTPAKEPTQLDRIEWMLVQVLLLLPYYDFARKLEDPEFSWSVPELLDGDRPPDPTRDWAGIFR